MKVIHTGDWHVTDGPGLKSTLNCLEEICDFVEKSRIDLVLVGGDMAGITVPHKATIAERLAIARILKRFAACAPVLVLYGNHDYDKDLDIYGMLKEDHPIKVLYGSGIVYDPAWSVAYCSYPTEASLTYGGRVMKEKGNAALAAEIGSLDAELRIRNKAVLPRILFGHFNVRGSIASGGEVMSAREIEADVATLQATEFDYVALSHIHKAQNFGSRIHYAGSPSRTKADEQEEKGANVVTIEAGKPPLIERIVTHPTPIVNVRLSYVGAGQYEPQ